MKLTGTITRSGAFPGTVKEKKTVLGQLGMNPSSIPVVVDHELSLSSTNPVQNRVITAAITNRLWSDEVKTALLQIVEKVAYIDDQGQDYYDALYDALYPPVGLDSISAVFDAGGATIYNTDTLDDLKQHLTVTAYYTDGTSETVTTYTLSGSMDAGTQTITVAYGGKTTTFTVTVVDWLVSISAAFTQGSATIYDTDSLDTLKQYLTVTATYADSTTATVTDYTLSGTLTAGTSTVTVSYGGKTDTFSCVTTHGFLYTPSRGLLTSQPYVSLSQNATEGMTETITNGILRFYSPTVSGSTSAWLIEFADFDYTTSARLSAEFKFSSVGGITAANATSPGTVFLQLFDGTTGGAIGGFAKTGANGLPQMRKTIGTSVTRLENTLSKDTWHEMVVEIANGKQSVTIDGVSIFSNENVATTVGYSSHTAMRLMQTSLVCDLLFRRIEVSVT